MVKGAAALRWVLCADEPPRERCDTGFPGRTIRLLCVALVCAGSRTQPCVCTAAWKLTQRLGSKSRSCVLQQRKDVWSSQSPPI